MFRHIVAIGADSIVRGTKKRPVLIEQMTIAGRKRHAASAAIKRKPDGSRRSGFSSC